MLYDPGLQHTDGVYQAHGGTMAHQAPSTTSHACKPPSGYCSSSSDMRIGGDATGTVSAVGTSAFLDCISMLFFRFDYAEK